MEGDYAQDLLPSLAPPPRLPETTVRPVGRIEIPPQSVLYLEPIGITEDHIADAPEGFRQAQESVPEVFEPPNRPEMMGLMKLVDTLKYCIIKLRRAASCRSTSGDVLEKQQRFHSRSRHRGLDEGDLSRGRRSPEVHRHSQSQREPQITQPFQEAQWQQPQSSQRFQGQGQSSIVWDSSTGVGLVFSSSVRNDASTDDSHVFESIDTVCQLDGSCFEFD